MCLVANVFAVPLKQKVKNNEREEVVRIKHDLHKFVEMIFNCYSKNLPSTRSDSEVREEHYEDDISERIGLTDETIPHSNIETSIQNKEVEAKAADHEEDTDTKFDHKDHEVDTDKKFDHTDHEPDSNNSFNHEDHEPDTNRNSDHENHEASPKEQVLHLEMFADKSDEHPTDESEEFEVAAKNKGFVDEENIGEDHQTPKDDVLSDTSTAETKSPDELETEVLETIGLRILDNINDSTNKAEANEPVETSNSEDNVTFAVRNDPDPSINSDKITSKVLLSEVTEKAQEILENLRPEIKKMVTEISESGFVAEPKARIHIEENNDNEKVTDTENITANIKSELKKKLLPLFNSILLSTLSPENIVTNDRAEEMGVNKEILNPTVPEEAVEENSKPPNTRRFNTSPVETTNVLSPYEALHIIGIRDDGTINKIIFEGGDSHPPRPLSHTEEELLKSFVKMVSDENKALAPTANFEIHKIAPKEKDAPTMRIADSDNKTSHIKTHSWGREPIPIELVK